MKFTVHAVLYLNSITKQEWLNFRWNDNKTHIGVFLGFSGYICLRAGAWYWGMCLDLLSESRQCQASVWGSHSAGAGGIHHVGDLSSYDLWPYCLQCGRFKLLWSQDLLCTLVLLLTRFHSVNGQNLSLDCHLFISFVFTVMNLPIWFA